MKSLTGNEKRAIWELMEKMPPQDGVTMLMENEDCKLMKVVGEGGEGLLTMYQVFDGVYLMYNDFHMKECDSRSSLVGPILCIDHCREGRIEMGGGRDVTYYMEQGDLRIDNQVHRGGHCRFPICHYHGVTIGFQTEIAQQALKDELPMFGFDLADLSAKFCSDDVPFVIHNEPAVEHLFYQLYQLPGRVQKDYFKVKILELLLYLGGMEVDPYRVERPYFYAGQVEKIRAIQELITSDLTRTYTAEELSRRFSISLTALKQCFKSTYGAPLHTYLKQYRMGQASSLLITRRDLKVSEIGALVGYDSPSKFTSAFRQMMGETPLAYRKSHGLER